MIRAGYSTRPGRLLALIGLGLFGFLPGTFAIGGVRLVENVRRDGSFVIADVGVAAGMWVDANDHAGVLRAARDLQGDITRVTGLAPSLSSAEKNSGPQVIIIGTIGKSRLVDLLIREGRLDVSAVAGQWESFVIQVIANPLPGVARGLIIAGSDKRGTIYGIYELSEQMGVSPWHWWADVPAEHRDALFVKPGRFAEGPPSVKYRGIFLNDEAPDLTGWVREKYGTVPGFNNVANYGHEFYSKVFELILRLRGNYLWPAMWNNAFNEDDPENPRLADEYGIVMGTSHQEPMLRAQKEWDRGPGRQNGNWNYNNVGLQPVLREFWREGIRRNKGYESIITLGLRAENDSGAPIGAALTGEIVAAQRKILTEELNPDLAGIPQSWCLYKEVQDFYDQGLRVPDDVTLLWADDNWGNLRRLPTADERKRRAGAGVYYHFDYHGRPRSYQWINTSPIPKIWDQLSLAKQYGADRIWVVNVGHLKGQELPLEFFMTLAWNCERWTNGNLNEFTRLWAEREFGSAPAAEIADILSRCTKYNGRRKPELLTPATYSLVNYEEAETVVRDYEAIRDKAEEIYGRLPPEKRDAFFELVLFPVRAGALVNELYLAAARNALYAKQGRASANDFAAETRALFRADTNLMDQFNHGLAHGRWDHFMDQPHLGYTGWQDPPRNNLDAVKLAELQVPEAAAMGVAVEGSEAAWPGATNRAALPQFNDFTRERHYLEVFNRGGGRFAFTATVSAPWITVNETGGMIDKDRRLWISVDWSRAPKGTADGTIELAGTGAKVSVKVETFNLAEPTRASLRGFVEGGGVVSIEPEHFSKNTDAGPDHWIRIEDYGRTLSGMRATGPVDAPAAAPGKDSPCLEYRLYLFSTGPAEVTAVTSPALNFMRGRPLRLGISFDDEPPRVVALVPADYRAQNGNRDWEGSVTDNARFVYTRHDLPRPGYHTLKIWMIDPGVVVQKLIVNLGGLQPGYLGPPESYHHDGGD